MKTQPIPQVILGQTGFVTTKLGLGTASWPHRIPYEQVVEMLETTFAAGIRYIDMAPSYMSEEIVGSALQEVGIPADATLATKAGSYSANDEDFGAVRKDYRAETITRSVERSLKRLGVDFLHIVHIHDVRNETLPDVFAKGGALEALQDLKRQGVIGAIGMGTLGLHCLQTAVDSDAFDVIQMFHVCTLLNQTALDKLMPDALAKGMSILNSAPFSGYILASGAVPDARYNYAPASPGVIEATKRIEAVCAQKDISLSTAAVAYSYQNPDIDVTVIASGKSHRVQEWIDAFDAPLTSADFDEMIAAAGGSYPVRVL
jgi:D-threo-aldose 1-dehydrogenase